jgi:hypothetical protein
MDVSGFLKFVLNGMFVLTALCLVGIRATRGKSWGPEGPVGGWLLLVPPLFLFGLALASMISLGLFNWVPGSKATAGLLFVGFLIASTAAMLYLFDEPKSLLQSLIGVAPFAMLVGCFVALNPNWLPEAPAKIVIAATLGTTAIAGWGLAATGGLKWVQRQDQFASSKERQAWDAEQSRIDEFRALAANAPVWQYFRFLNLVDPGLRAQCREAIAKRPDLNQQLIEYLASPVLAGSAVNYIGDVAENPSAELAPALGTHMSQILEEYRELLKKQSKLSDRGREDATSLLAAASRVQKSSGDLRPQAAAWRDYLSKFPNASDLAHQAGELAR